ncbi:hypothetical protein TrLO_g9081 [Triparma laevis f. longispina]|uniref:Uncharacterized protein n=1 Tax=Triparma laevis f. longispina TaxID=1714387 RepID=A0A9W7EAH1_9STRA|nr:hypothetical protein TrLO_g9081 [Triparma laevis f. longispina]
MASLDSMDSDEFDAFSAAFLQKYLNVTYVELELGDVEAKKRIANRRGSMAGGLDPDQARANIENLHVAVLKVLGWAGADKDNIEELAEQFDSVVANYVDLVEAISAWFDKSVPTQGMTEEQKEGFKLFLISVARRNMLAKKMARIGVAWKLVLILGLGYLDLVTDLLVAKSYFDAGDLSTAYATVGFAVLTIVLQGLLTFFNYWKKFVFAMSLFGEAFGSRKPIFLLLGVEFCIVCTYKGWKGELFGFALVSKPSPFNDYILPFIVWAFEYLLVSAVPMMITAAPCELGPEVFAGTVVWRLLTNTGIVYIALGALAKKEHYLSLTTGMTGYGASLGVVVVGLAMFLMSCDTNFDRSLFWKAKSGKQHVRECWRSETIWTTKRKSKDAEIWGWFAHIHPIFFPFDLLTPWICEELFEKYGNEGVERPEWMNEENNGKFIKRVVEIYIWKGGVVGAKVDVALAKLFGRNGADLEAGVDGKLSFIQSKKSRKGIKVNKVQPEELAV